jgi:ATP-dependent RNA helicase hrpA
MAEILVIAYALSIQDSRERPLEARDVVAKATDKQSDFLAYLNIWDSFQRERDKGLSNKQLVQCCPNISCRTCRCVSGVRLKWV